jgi:outer membrane protein OmpA-like peptidoglycan-associated protein
MLKKTLISISIAGLFLTGCANQNYSNTQKGAAAGAVVGALAGKATGDNDKSRYAWGAVVGALAGGAIGTYMDRQEEDLREELADTDIEVYREGDNLRLVMPSNITFDSGESSLNPRLYPVLTDVSAVLNEYNKTSLRIVGHTDSTGAAEYNQQLSLARANQVKGFLNQQGVDNRRFIVEGQGEFSPVATNDTAQGREQNRRVELSIVPVTERS